LTFWRFTNWIIIIIIIIKETKPNTKADMNQQTKDITTQHNTSTCTTPARETDLASCHRHGDHTGQVPIET